jgi:penicillin-binding protein 1A
MNSGRKVIRKRKTKKEKLASKGIFLFLSIFFKILLVFGIITAVAAVGILSGTLYGYIDTASELNLSALQLNFTSFVYYVDPETNEPVELERLYGEENRIWADIDIIPQDLQDAFIAIEDQRFMSHPGFDIKRTTKAALNYLIRHDSSYGGSTITQQLIKNLTKDEETSIRRKIQEIYKAVNLEKQLTKKQILEYYLNTIYLSQGCNGVQAAANTYFDKDVNELSLAESACIAGITQYPSKYDPFVNPKNNKEKQELVLGKMLELGYIDENEYEIAKNETLNLKRGEQKEKVSKQSYFVDQVINDVLSDLMEEKNMTKQLASKLLYTGGLKIYATIDPNIQKAMDSVYKDEEFFASNLFPQFEGNIQPESSMLIMDPYSGEVKGMVGGRGTKTAKRTLNRATQTLRQPGSSIKPLGVYAPAIEYGYVTLGTVIDDVPVDFDGWIPRNYGGKFNGLTTVRSAIELSRNIPAVKVLNILGIEKSYEFLTNNFSISSLVESDKRSDGKVYTDKNLNSLALGGLTDGISVMEMTAAYTPFVNKGVYVKPYTYTKVLDHEDNTVLETKKNSHIAMSEQTASLMSHALNGVVDHGTATVARLENNMPAAGKTGTTSDYLDKWFIGYTPYYCGGVWYGFDEPKSMGTELVGKQNPSALIWGAVMNKVHENLEVKDFYEAQDIIKVPICKDSGKLPNEFCSSDQRGNRVYYEYFKKGTEPTTKCDVHVSAKVDINNNLLANEYCPEDLVEEKVFIKRTEPYVPLEDRYGNPIYPLDYEYEYPDGEYCNEHGPSQNEFYDFENFLPDLNIINNEFRTIYLDKVEEEDEDE